MNKKLLFAAMSLVALTACTNDDFQSKQQIAEEASPVKFEVINNAFTRASMSGNKIVWNANDGDLFTLYHGGAAPAITGYQNATYTANVGDAGAAATLSTPSMILPGSAIMVWPVDTTFRITAAGNLSLQIPTELKDIENNIPYVSDVVTIGGYVAKDPADPTTYTNIAGYDRVYPVFMRPMASQLTIKTDYAGTDATLASLYTGDDPIEKIKVTSMDLLTTAGGGATDFTQEIRLAFTPENVGVDDVRWDAAVPNNAWDYVTGFGAVVNAVDKLTAKDKCLTGNESCKFLILPQTNIGPGAPVDDGGVVVNTIYGKVIIANGVHGSQYTGAEIADAWYRFISATTATYAGELQDPTITDADGKIYTYSEPKVGMGQTISNFTTATVSDATSVVAGEPVGAATTRYVKVLLTHLDMSGLHITNDKQLRDAARVWQKMGLPTVCVYLDGPEFNISQKTIQTINEINAAEAPARSFTVKPCTASTAATAAEVCQYIVITGGGEIQDLRFIDKHEDNTKAKVAFNEGENWIWKDVVTVNAADVESITNRGTMTNAATVTLKTAENATPLVQNNVPFINDGTWNIVAPAVVNVQFDVVNYGTLNIGTAEAPNAQYRQDGRAFSTLFTNEATDKPSRFGGDDDAVGVIWNYGVLGTVSTGGNKADINNYGLIEHADEGAKTFITRNQTATTGIIPLSNPVATYAANANFANAFNATAGSENKMGRINLPFSNKAEDNISISADLDQGFVSVTVNGEPGTSGALNASVVGPRVNYVIVKKGPSSIASLSTQVKYLEVNMTDKSELAWSVATPTAFDGLMVLTDLNIKLGTTVQVKKAVYLGADMYVGGKLNNGTPGVLPSWTGYYGNTTANFATNYITY